jgi:hypothetical protein
MAKQRSASIELTSFNCPHCGSLAHQTWYTLHLQQMGKNNHPSVPSDEFISHVKNNPNPRISANGELFKSFQRIHEVFLKKCDEVYTRQELGNVAASECFSCDKFTLWLHWKIIYPAMRLGEEANEDLSAEVRRDYDEARTVLDLSPRAAAALLRLCIQKICGELGENGSDLNQDIGKLVARGLDVRVQQALDVVRVVGNNAVHPGQIDLRDDRTTATQLFRLVNLIAEKMITEPKHVEAMFNTLPENARAQIAKRDTQRQRTEKT